MPPTPRSRNPLAAYILIGLIALAVLGLFAWTAGLLMPKRISGGSMIDSLQANTGKIYAGFRRAHTKGMCVNGYFDSNGAGQRFSKATVFQPGRTVVAGRFSTGGGMPMSPDLDQIFHALGLRFLLPGNEEWRMAMDQTPIFVASTPAQFQDLQYASTPVAATGQPDPAKMAAYFAKYPDGQNFFNYMKTHPMPSSFADGTYYSIDAFRFIAPDGTARVVRWQFDPETPFTALDSKAKLPDNFLFDDLIDTIRRGPIKWRMNIVFANPGDRTNSATIAWTGPHKTVDVGTLTLNQATTEERGSCRQFNFDPTMLPRGVAVSDDPLLPARSAAYSADFRRRAIEGHHPDPLSGQMQATFKQGESQ